MNKNSILGFVLIGAILIGFSWYNSKIFKEQERERAKTDSIARVEANRVAQEMAKTTPPLSLDSNSIPVADAITADRTNTMYKDTLLSIASIAADERKVLENKFIKVEFSNIGAQPKSVQVKEFKTYDSLDLMLFKEKRSNLSLNLFTNQQLSTSNFGFNLYSSDDTSLVYRLYIDRESFVEYKYTLPAESYMMDFNIRLVGMNKHIPRNISFLDLEWSIDMPRQEKGYDNEKNYSTIVYKFPNSKSVEDLGLRKDNATEEVRTKVNWFAFQQQFFSAIMVAKDNFNSGLLSYVVYPEGDPDNNLMRCNAIMQVPYVDSPEINIPLEFYYGPNHFKTLKSYDYGFEKIVPLGGWIIGWINRYIVILVFDFLSRFITNFGLIIFLLTILIKIVISPLTLKSYMSSAKMKVLKPEIDKINAKYPKSEDSMKKQQEVMALYSKTGVSMFGGCLPMLLQFPILFAMFRFFPASFELRQESFLWAEDLSAYDSVLSLPFTIPLYGDHVSLFAILMAVSMYFYSRMNIDQMSAGPQMAGMKYMSLYFMPLFLLVLCNNFSSGLSYYYMLSNVITIGQTWLIRKYFVDEAKIYAKLQEKAATPKKKSKFQERLDNAYRAQQQQTKNKR
ncbi:MAG: membrane protein insertase YidC [Bacteroidetes bacterium HGW-Bacteroidetes-5]|jgi:YidC/Oxa1 family membrane protein insertase|nr:MAG: membrane protein insertase YidC [Bacteroidetes bacterium HGW-Bacteroidetes-5]